MIDRVVDRASAWRFDNITTVQSWYIWRRWYFVETHGMNYMNDVTQGLKHILRRETERLQMNLSRASLGTNRILPVVLANDQLSMGMMGADWFAKQEQIRAQSRMASGLATPNELARMTSPGESTLSQLLSEPC